MLVSFCGGRGRRVGGWLAVGGPLILAALVCARVEWGSARSPVSAHAHVFLAQELVLVLGAAVLAAAAAWLGLRRCRDAVTLAVGALVALEIASAATASDPWLALRSATLWISGLVVFTIAREIGMNKRELALSALLLPLGLVAGSALVEAVGVVRLSAPRHAPGGLLGERNVAAELLVVSAPVLAYLAIVAGHVWRRRAALVVLTVAAAAVVLARTRSAWLAGLALSLPLAVLVLRRASTPSERSRGGRVAGAIAVGIAIALVLPTTLRWKSAHPYRDSLVHLVDSSTPSGHGRLVQYATTARMAIGHPGLGVGPGNWATQYLAFARPGDPTIHEGIVPVNRLPNSDVLGFAAERGLVAFGLLLALVVMLFRQAGPSAELRALRRATLLAVIVASALDAVLQTPAALLFVAWTVGLTSGTEHPALAADGASGTARPRLGISPTFATACVALAILAVPAMRRVASFDLAARARGSEDLERATILDPGDVGLRLVAAESWIAEGRCDRAREHLAAVARYSPSSPARRELEARCSSVPAR
ncbi:MAG TPA: O-antigen ligase family protein [Labilithrix sp.]|nr:O-antigen ligase family protein [Labilithrix sp.]